MSNYDMDTTIDRTACAFVEVSKTIQVHELFGTLIKLATKDGTMETFFSDLYHDCFWLHQRWKQLKQEGGFFWSVRSSGTAISSMFEDVDSGGRGERIYRISFTQ